MNWRDVLSGTAQERPHATAFRFHSEELGEPELLDWAGLDARARAVAAHLADLGLAGRSAVLLFPAGLDYVAAFFGCLYAGVVAVPAYPPSRNARSTERLAAIVRDSGAEVALTTAVIRDRLAPRLASADGVPPLRLVATDAMSAEDAPAWRAPRIGEDATAFLQYTSGSTSTPRGVVLSHGNLLHNTAMIARVFGLDTGMRGVSWLPMYHDMGLIGSVMGTVRAGGTMSLMAPSTFARDPLRWLGVVAEERATVTGGPNFAYDLAVERTTEEQRAALDLSSWQVAYNGAEPVRPASLHRFAEAFAVSGFRPEAFLPCYGLAEGSLLVTGGPAGTGFRTCEPPAGSGVAGELVASGVLPPEQRLEIVDPETRLPVAAGEVGEVWVAGPSVARGYFNRTDAVADTFGALVEGGDGTGFLRTGDLGFLSGDGDARELYVTGRRKDLIIVRGRNHYPQDIELTAERCSPALRGNGGAAFSVTGADGGEQLVVVQELIHGHGLADPAELARTVQARVAEQHEVRPHAVVLIRTASLPRTSSGKVARHACRAAYLAGELLVTAVHADEEQPAAAGGDAAAEAPVPAAGDREAVLAHLRRAAAVLLRTRPEEVPADASPAALGLDSLDSVRLLHRLQREFGLELGPEEAFSLTLAELADAIATADSGASGTAPAPLADAPPGDGELSHGQRAMWFMHRMDPDGSAYHLAAAAELSGEVDAAALRRALAAVVRRHAALRTTFPEVGDGPVQRVHAVLEPEFTETDASAWPAERMRAELTALAYRPFDVEAGPLLRVALLRRGPGRHRLVVSLHHLVSDLWSLEILLRELGAHYRAETGGPVPGARAVPGFGAAVRRRAGRLAGPEGERLWEFWQRELAGAPTVLELPADHVRPARRRAPAGVRRFRLEPGTAAALGALARAEGTTLYTVLLSAYQLMLGRTAGQASLLVGSPVHGREHADTAEVVGPFLNTAVLRADLVPGESFTALLRRAARSVPAALRHSAMPLSLLVERSRVARDTSRTPLVQALFTLQSGPLAAFVLGDPASRFDLGGLEMRPVPLDQPHAQMDLQLTFAEVDGTLSGLLQFDRALFEDATAERMAAGLCALLDAVAADPERPVALLPLMPAAERAVVLHDRNDTAVPGTSDTPVHALVAAQAARTPDAPALAFDDTEYALGPAGPAPDADRVRDTRTLSYRELDAAVNRLARLLLARGLRAEETVAVRLPHDETMVVAMLAVLRAGGSYLPVDPHLPAERIAYLLADSGARIVITDSSVDTAGSAAAVESAAAVDASAAAVDASAAGPVRLVLDELAGELAALPASSPAVSVRPDQAAYLLYTSGSTGRPKGVQVPHGALANFLAAMVRLLGPAEGGRLLAVTTFSFDISALEAYLPLITGGCSHIVPRRIAAAGEQLRVRLESGAFSMMQATPATWRLLCDAGWTGTPGLAMASGGEALSPGLARTLLSFGTGTLWNLYGPTETTVWSTGTQVTAVPGAATPLGAPVANTQVYVLDAALEPVPAGAAGELLIGGAGLARGYLGRPGLTAAAFVPDPYGDTPGARLYRTGDLARTTADGRTELLGRVDNQVKVNGHRIELGEIDAALSRLPELSQGVAVVHRPAPDAPAVLAAYVRGGRDSRGADFDERVTTRVLREELARVLPAYMVPARFVWVDGFPLNTSGKVDRAALKPPAPEQDAPRDEPATATERELAGILAELLGTGAIGRTDNLFDHGAHSLLMSRFAVRVRESLGAQLPLRVMFETPTLEHLAAAVDALATADAPPRPGGGAGRITRIDRTRQVALVAPGAAPGGGKDALRALRAARRIGSQSGS
ncbi:amino acid adenylation domain-containing protein [Streptomyces sp. NPDC090741]|uniref:amino acid adenylation domain-containing protein n=1 Tax=Streptomyces sp. NPDC090741 TaxID=3365967 RepID=UPI0038171577